MEQPVTLAARSSSLPESLIPGNSQLNLLTLTPPPSRGDFPPDAKMRKIVHSQMSKLNDLFSVNFELFSELDGLMKINSKKSLLPYKYVTC
jgi:hypothetical protein